jgi:MFS family permease
VANLNLSVANVALPSIGQAFDSSQVALNLIAVGYSLALAASVLYLGAVGDRYGRKMMLVLGTALAIPMSLLAAYAPSDEALFVACVGGGLAAGMAFPTTLALITALWSGPARTKSIALWSALGGAIAALGPFVSGATKSFASTEAVAEQHPQYSDAIIAGAKEAFLQGDDWAYAAGVVAILLGAALVYFMFPSTRKRSALSPRTTRRTPALPRQVASGQKR